MITAAEEKIILVDPHDLPLGEIEKLLAHQYAMLHRAFSVLIFRLHHQRTELLLQQRNLQKYHGGGLWTNTCCSHPHPGEELQVAAEKRLKEEMGIGTHLIHVGKFHYVATFANGLTENEIDHVFVGTYTAEEIPFNPQEVQAYAWVDIGELQDAFKTTPEKYTVWFKQAFEIALNYLHTPEGASLLHS